MSFTGDDRPEFLRGLGITLLRYTTVAGSGLLWTVLITRSFEQSEVGVLLLVLSFAVLIPPLIDLGWPTTISYFAAVGEYGEPALISLASSAIVRISMGFLVILLLATRALVSLVSPAILTEVVIGLLVVPFALAISIASGFLRGTRQWSRYASLTSAPAVLLLLLTVLATLISKPAVMTSVVIIVIAYAVPAVASTVWLLRRASSTPPSLAATAFRYAWPLYIGHAAGALRTRGELVLVAALLGPASAALFGTGIVVASQLAIVAQAAFVIVLPFVAGDGKKERASPELTSLASRVSSAATFLLAIVIVALGPSLLSLLFGQGYLASWPVMVAYLPGVVLLSISRVLTSDLSGRGRTHLLMRIDISMAGVVVVLIAAFTIAMGIVGAAIGASLGALINTYWRGISFRRITGVRLRTLVGLRRTDIREIRLSIFGPWADA